MTKETVSSASEKAVKFSKEQLISAARYAKRRDLLSVLLESGKTYSVEEVDSQIAKFMKGKVN